MKSIFLCLVVSLVASPAFAQGKASQKPDALAIDSACATDSATANCGSDQVGTGLLKCLHAYKKAHKDYKFSDSCKQAMMKARADHKAAH